jgi:hypothetical protein
MGDRSVSYLTPGIELAGSSRRTSARRVGLAFFGPRSLRSLILALPYAHFFEIGFPVFTAHLAGLVAICDSPLLIGLSGLLRIGGAPLAEAKAAASNM